MKEMLLKRKVISRVLGAVLCLVMYLLLMPTTVFAAGNISRVNIVGVSVPIAGERVGDNLAKITTGDSSYVISAISWMCDTPGHVKPMLSDEVFEEGLEYTLQVSVEPSNSAFYISEDAVLVFNDGNYDADFYLWISGKNMIGNTVSKTASPAPTPAYLVYFDANGGYRFAVPERMTKLHDVDLILPTETPFKSCTLVFDANGGTVDVTSKTIDCTFKAWNTRFDGSGTEYAPGSTFSSNSSITMHAQWEIPAVGSLPVPTRSGYVFDGWYLEITSGPKITSDSVVSDSYTRLYAHWKHETIALKPDEAVSCTMTKGSSTYFTFTAPADGIYMFMSEGSLDTYGMLYFNDSFESSYNGSAYGGTGKNFCIRESMKAGSTIYLQVRGNEGLEDGSYTVIAAKKIEITKQPADAAVEVGKTATFSVTADGADLTYQWQYRNAGESTWSNSGAAAAKTANMTFTVGTDKTLNGRQYRCVVRDKLGESMISNTVTLTVTQPLKITKQPANVTAEAGKSVTFSVTATGEGLTYQWQYRNAGATTWSNSNATAAKTANMTFTVGTDKTLNGRQYRCIVKDKYGKTVTSNAATLTVGTAAVLAITSQPTNQTAAPGASVSFKVTATGEGLTYQWQYKNASASDWSNSGAAAAKTANMTFTVGTDKTLNGRQYRCIVKDKYGKTVTSNAATLTVSAGPAITSQPANQTAAVGASVSFKVTATGEGLTYQWQYKNASASDWSNSGAAAAKTANMTFTVGTDKTLNGRQYRCVVTDKNGNKVTSNAATLTVSAGLAITSQPANVTAAVGTSVSFKVTATGEGLTYQWQYKNAGASTWSNSGAAAAKTANMTFTVGTDKTLNGRQYRCVVTDKNGNTVTSNAATLTVK